jgi:hypothetical protein
MLNITGDITISWDTSTSKEVKQWIQNKIDSGHTFFLVEKTCFGLINKKKKIKDSADLINKKGKIKLTNEQEKMFLNKQSQISFSGDREIEELVVNNLVSAKRTDFSNTKTTKAIKNVGQIISSNTICVKPMMGG